MKPSGKPAAAVPATDRSWLRPGLLDFTVLLIYSAMVETAVRFYQQSLDEGREWVIAGSFSIPHLLFHVLHYEGHPPLIYLLLWLPAHLHMPLAWINGLSALVGISSAYLLLRLSPFPFYLRALLPFCFAFGYQEAVVARSYVLFPLLGFIAVHLYRSRPHRPLALATVLALLANVSFHGSLVAIGFAIAYAIDIWTERRRTLSPGSATYVLKASQLWPSAGLFAACLLLVAICIIPQKYVAMDPMHAMARIVHRIQGPSNYATDAPVATVPTAAPVQSIHDATPTPRPQKRSWQHRYATPLWLVFVYPFSMFPWLSCAFQILVLGYLVTRRQWALLLPIALLDYFLIFGFVDYRHTPLVWITTVLVLWAAWDTTAQLVASRVQAIVACSLALLCILQIPATLRAIPYERHHATFPAIMTATWLKTLPSGTRIDGDRSAYAMVPYLRGYLPPDRSGGRFTDHASYATSATTDSLIRDHADVLLLDELLDSQLSFEKLQSSGYGETHTFCGGPYFPNAPIGVKCFHVFTRR